MIQGIREEAGNNKVQPPVTDGYQIFKVGGKIN
jgi:hypothetical protein